MQISSSRALAAIAWMAILPVTAATAATTAPPPPASVFGRLPAVQFVAVSPNGKLLARDEEYQGSRRILVFEADTGKIITAAALDENNKLRDISWADDETVLINVSASSSLACTTGRKCTYEWFRVLAVHLDKSKPTLLLMNDADRKWVTGARVLAVNNGTPGKVTMSSLDHMDSLQEKDIGSNIKRAERDSSGWVSVAFEVDTRSGKGKSLAVGTPYTLKWIVGANGQPIARSEWRDEQGLFQVVALQPNGRWQEVHRSVDGHPLSIMGVTPDGAAIVALGTNGTDRSKAWAIPLDGSGIRVLHEQADADVDYVIYDSWRNVVVAIGGDSSDTKTQWLEKRYGDQQRSLASAYRGKRVTIMDRSADSQRAIAQVDSLSQPPIFNLVDFARSRSDTIAEAYPALINVPLGETKFIHYPARDGTSIPAYLTLPPGSTGKDLPTVIMPHGGPESRDDDGFDYMVQFLATRGYAVLQPQFRGSTGFGEDFRKAGYRQWGKLMQDDVSDGVAHLVSTGVASKNRVCIVGASYGGYSALAGGAYTPDLYACVVSINGVADLPEMLVNSSIQDGDESNSVGYWREHIGSPRDPEVIAKSPSRSAKTFRAPVLLMHGAGDSVVPYSQSENMARQLKQAGKPYAFIKLDGEDHWLSRSGTRTRVLEELERFLAQHLLQPAG